MPKETKPFIVTIKGKHYNDQDMEIGFPLKGTAEEMRSLECEANLNRTGLRKLLELDGRGEEEKLIKDGWSVVIKPPD
jgi:hypothetical protein